MKTSEEKIQDLITHYGHQISDLVSEVCSLQVQLEQCKKSKAMWLTYANQTREYAITIELELKQLKDLTGENGR